MGIDNIKKTAVYAFAHSSDTGTCNRSSEVKGQDVFYVAAAKCSAPFLVLSMEKMIQHVPSLNKHETHPG